jgi:hypothetical protein
MPGSRDVFRHAPLLHPDDLVDAISSEWALLVSCSVCKHHTNIGSIREVASARGIVRVEQLLRGLKCSRCGAYRPRVRTIYARMR